MNLIWFFTIATFLSLTLGEFGHIPFGTSSNSVSLMDLLMGVTLTSFLIWQVGIKKKVVLPVLYKALLAFILVGVLSLLVNYQFFSVSGLGYLLRFMVYSSSFLVGFYLIESKVIVSDSLVRVIVLVSLVISVLGFSQLLVYPDLEPLTVLGYDPHKNRLVSTFLDPNFTGAMLGIGCLLSFYLYQKRKLKFWLLSSVIILIALILTYSRSAYLMFLVEAVVYGFFRARRAIIFLLILLVGLYFVIPQFSQRINGAFLLDKSASERFGSWQNGFLVFERNPIFGVGFNNLRVANERYDLVKLYSEDGGHSGAGVDSSFIFVLATTGIAGFVIYSLFWGVTMFGLFKNRSKEFDLSLVSGCIILGLLVESQFVNSLFYPPIMLTVFSLLGVALGEIEQDED